MVGPIMDFPANPIIGQHYVNTYGTVYEWDGVAWVAEISSAALETVGDLIGMIRVLLQDTENIDGQPYRYPTNDLVEAMNMGFIEMYRIRPDIFLELQFAIPSYSSGNMQSEITIEQQFIPALVYYTVGMAQLRDDEPTQDDRASSFLAKFTSMLVSVA